MVEHLLHKECHSATVERIPSKYGVSIVQKWKHFVAVPIGGRRAALAVSKREKERVNGNILGNAGNSAQGTDETTPSPSFNTICKSLDKS